MINEGSLAFCADLFLFGSFDPFFLLTFQGELSRFFSYLGSYFCVFHSYFCETHSYICKKNVLQKILTTCLKSSIISTKKKKNWNLFISKQLNLSFLIHWGMKVQVGYKILTLIDDEITTKCKPWLCMLNITHS